MKLPGKITPCPIIEALAEIRFETDYPAEAIFGMIYSKLNEDYSNPINLPIMQIPDQFRKLDPNFKFKPHYQLENEGYLLRFGPDVLSISTAKSKQDYPGWEKLGAEIKRVIDKVIETGIIKKITRLAVRYIDYFEENIFDNIKIDLLVKDKAQNNPPLVIHFCQELNGFKHFLRVANEVVVSDERSGEKLSGSMLDIDTVLIDYDDSTISNLDSLFKSAHDSEKELFFSLLNEDFLEELSPEYN